MDLWHSFVIRKKTTTKNYPVLNTDTNSDTATSTPYGFFEREFNTTRKSGSKSIYHNQIRGNVVKAKTQSFVYIRKKPASEKKQLRSDSSFR
jgi:hypothetical protein